MAFFEVKQLTIRFGGLTALEKVSFEVQKGQIYAIIGPNGAGKTTLFNVITGFHNPDTGRVFFKSEDITGLAPHNIFRKRLFRTFQIAREYREMSVLENLLLIPEHQIGEQLWNAWFSDRQVRRPVSYTHLRAHET